MCIRHTGAWQRVYDDRILEYLADHDIATAETIAKQLPQRVPKSLVYTRMRMLAQAGYVEPEEEPVGRRRYSLTRWGRLYLDGRVRADCLDPEPSPARPGFLLG